LLQKEIEFLKKLLVLQISLIFMASINLLQCGSVQFTNLWHWCRWWV